MLPLSKAAYMLNGHLTLIVRPDSPGKSREQREREPLRRIGRAPANRAPSAARLRPAFPDAGPIGPALDLHRQSQCAITRAAAACRSGSADADADADAAAIAASCRRRCRSKPAIARAGPRTRDRCEHRPWRHRGSGRSPATGGVAQRCSSCRPRWHRPEFGPAATRRAPARQRSCRARSTWPRWKRVTSIGPDGVVQAPIASRGSRISAREPIRMSLSFRARCRINAIE